MPVRGNIAAADVMSAPVLSIPPETPIDGIERIMREHFIGALPVTDAAGLPIGIVTWTDLVRDAGGREQLDDRTAADLMCWAPFLVARDTPVENIAQVFRTCRLRHALVISGDALIGIVSETDLQRKSSADQALRAPSSSDERLRCAILQKLMSVDWTVDRLPEFTVCEGVVRFWGTPPTAEEVEAVVRAARSVGS